MANLAKNIWRGKRIGVLSLFILLINTIFSSSCHSTQQSVINIKPGDAAPDLNLKAARGDTYDLANFRGQAILLSFIDTQAKATNESDPSRAQIVFLKSMQEQYSAKGLHVWIVDAARQETGKQPTENELINFTYDWQLDTIPVLIDKRAEVAKAFGISKTPATFLIDTQGVVQQRWDGMASASQLALAIETLVGAPAYRSTESFATTQSNHCPDQTPPQAKFAGLGLARPLSDEIWVIDNGNPWGLGSGFPLRWIVIDSKNKSEKQHLQLRVTAHYLDSKNDIMIVDQNLSLLPEEEAHGLLVAQNNDVHPIYSLITTINLDQPGCLELDAIVTETLSPIYDGQAIVSVK